MEQKRTGNATDNRLCDDASKMECFASNAQIHEHSMRILQIITLAFALLFSQHTLAQREYSSKSKKAIKFFEDGLKLYSARRNAEALELFNKAIKADEAFVEAHAVAGDCYTDLGQHESAIEAYQKVVDLNPDFLVTSFKQLADAQFRVGDYENAASNYTIFLTKKRVHPKSKEQAEKYLKDAEFGAI
ncbi:MAG: tetratricopeptide repeat protein, partial [Bacteroidetes bacterium]